MKYTISAINQAGIEDAGLIEKTDVIDWCLLDYVYDWQQNPKATHFEGMVWLSFKHLIREMPLLGIKDKSAISRRFKKLKELELIDTYQSTDDFRLYGRTTILYYDISKFKVLPVDLKQHPLTKNNSESFKTTDPLIQNNTPVDLKQHSTVIPINSNTKEPLREGAPKKAKNSGGKNEQAKKEMGFKKPTMEQLESYINENGFSVDAGRFFDFYESNGWKVGRSAMKNWQATARNWNRENQKGSGTSSKKAGVSDKPRNYVYTPTNQTGSYSDESVIDSTATTFYEPSLITS
jgi:hypothetical protein